MVGDNAEVAISYLQSSFDRDHKRTADVVLFAILLSRSSSVVFRLWLQPNWLKLVVEVNLMDVEGAQLKKM